MSDRTGETATLDLSWEDERDAAAGEVLIVDVDGFEGPLDLLLAMARAQKVDLARIAILPLAEQYLSFIEEVHALRLEIAGDYLVMAAWLAFLKSKLLLPREDDAGDEPSGEELAAQLAFRLKRLKAMREAAEALQARNRLGRDVFARGAPEPVRITRESAYTDTLYDLLKAYTERRQRTVTGRVEIRQRVVWSIKQARERLEALLGRHIDWAPLETYLDSYLTEAEDPRSAIASTFGATLELAREGTVELSQAQAFAPIYLRPRAGPRPLLANDET